MTHVVIVEDDPAISEMLAFHIKEQGYEATVFENGAEARDYLLEKGADIAILDIMLPGCNGLDICKAVRQKFPALPILMLTSLDGEIDRVLGLELGADDYLTKPFSMRECTARVKALLRRSQLLAEPIQEIHSENISIDELELDVNGREAHLEGNIIELTAREFDLLLYLVKNQGKVYSRSQLLDEIWGYSHDGYEHTINTHINRLRNKLKRSEGKADFIQTVWGVGYKFAAQSEVST